MTWDTQLEAMLEDLEQQADGLQLAERDGEVADRARAEYAEVTLASRLDASLGMRIRLGVVGVGTVEGSLHRTGAGWLLLAADTPPQEWIIRADAVSWVGGASSRSVADAALPATRRLGFRSALRGLADRRSPVRLHGIDGSVVDGELRRVGQDFVEVGDPARVAPTSDGSTTLVSHRQLAAVRCIPW